METLTSQYLALSKCSDGMVDVTCDPCTVCASAAKQVQELVAWWNKSKKVKVSLWLS